MSMMVSVCILYFVHYCPSDTALLVYDRHTLVGLRFIIDVRINSTTLPLVYPQSCTFQRKKTGKAWMCTGADQDLPGVFCLLRRMVNFTVSKPSPVV